MSRATTGILQSQEFHPLCSLWNFRIILSRSI